MVASTIEGVRTVLVVVTVVLTAYLGGGFAVTVPTDGEPSISNLQTVPCCICVCERYPTDFENHARDFHRLHSDQYMDTVNSRVIVEVLERMIIHRDVEDSDDIHSPGL